MSKSIVSNKRQCYICKTESDLHKHHIFYGTANRRKSEHWGCWVYLCGAHHNLSNEGVHFNKRLDTMLKRECQIKWMIKNQLDVDDFIMEFGRSYV